MFNTSMANENKNLVPKSAIHKKQIQTQNFTINKNRAHSKTGSGSKLKKKKSGSGCATHPELLPAADVHVEELETVKGLVVSDFSLAKSLRGYSQPYKHAHCV